MKEKTDKNLISLKEAAEISGYSADYIGQLIRAGKIPGKQVYTNITWMTTAEAVMEYKTRKRSKSGRDTVGQTVTGWNRRIFMELKILRLFFRTFRHALPIMIVLIISFVLLSGYLLSLAFSEESASAGKPEIESTNSLTF